MAVTGYFDAVQKIYIAFYQRPADPAGLRYWAERLEAADGDSTAIINGFANSAEAQSLYGPINDATIGDVIGSIYQALFGRAPDDAGKAYYETEFANGKLTEGNIALAILNASKNDDQTVISNKLVVANKFTEKVDGRPFDNSEFGKGDKFAYDYTEEGKAVAARAALAKVNADPKSMLDDGQVKDVLDDKVAAPVGGGGGFNTPHVVTLTVDDDTAAAHVFNAPVLDGENTLNTDDILTGSGQNATLNFTFAEEVAGHITTPTLKNINTINIDVDGDTGARNLSLKAAAGVQKVNVTGVEQSAPGENEGVALSITDIKSIRDEQGVRFSLDNIKASTASVHLAFDKTTTVEDSDTAEVTLNSTVLGNLSIDAQENFWITSPEPESDVGVEQVTLVSTGTEANALIQLSAPDLETLNIEGTQDLMIGSLYGSGGRLVFTPGFASVPSLSEVNASDLDANLFIVLGKEAEQTDASGGAKFSYVGSKGSDVIVLTSGIGAGTAIDGGDEDDALVENTVVTLGSLIEGDVRNVQNLMVLGQGVDSPEQAPVQNSILSAPSSQTIAIDASRIHQLEEITIQNGGAFDGDEGVNKSNALTTELNNLTSEQAKNITVVQGAVGSNGLGQNVIKVSIKEGEDVRDAVALTIDEDTGGSNDATFNVTLNVGADVREVTLTDNDDVTNSVDLGAFSGRIDSALILNGGEKDDFLNLDATSLNGNHLGGFGIEVNGSATGIPSGNGIPAFTSVLGDQVFVGAKIDADQYLGNVIVRVGEASQVLELGSGDDTIIFADRTGLTKGTAGLTSADTVKGGGGNDTVVLDGAGEQRFGVTEWQNVSGIDTIRLSDNGGSHELLVTNGLVEQTDAGNRLTIISDGHAKVDARGLDLKNSIIFRGGVSGETVILNEASANSNNDLNGGAGGGNTLQILNSAVVTADDLVKVKNFETIEFRNDQNRDQKLSLTLSSSVVDGLVESSMSSLTIKAFDDQRGGAAILDVEAGTATRSMVVTGDSGADKIIAGAGDDRIAGGAGDDVIEGGLGNDTIDGGWGADDLKGGDGNDYITGDVGGDFIDGGAGNDTLKGGLGDDHIVGGDGDDSIDGGWDSDDLSGGAGDDYITGDWGDDCIDGGTGNDTLEGGLGDDDIVGGAGGDKMTGGTGSDVFVYTSLADSYFGSIDLDAIDAVQTMDTIIGFDATWLVKDKIDLSGVTFASTANNELYQGFSSFKGSSQDVVNSAISQLQGHATLDYVIDAAIKGMLVAEVSWFSFEGNRYVVGDTGSESLSDHLVIQLTGGSGTLSESNFDFWSDLSI